MKTKIILASLLSLALLAVAGCGPNVPVSPEVKGDLDAKVTITEYADFQCPACAAYSPIVAETLEQFPEGVKLEFFHYPLAQIHPNAVPAAIASEAAGRQGKFWEMHDLLFAGQPEWSQTAELEPIFAGYAEQLGLDVEQFAADYNDSLLESEVKAHYNSALRNGIQATPTFLVNGNQLQPNPASPEEFAAIVQAYLEEGAEGVEPDTTESTEDETNTDSEDELIIVEPAA